MDNQYANPFEEDQEATALLNSFDKAPPKRAPELVEQSVKAAEEVSDQSGYHRRAKPKKKKVRRSKFYETGRNKPISLKGRGEDYDRMNALCDRQEWVKGQLLQYALDALAEKIADPKSNFWADRNFNGVE